MKLKVAIFFIIFTFQFLYSQPLTWTPFFSTRDDTITIDYDVTQGNGALIGVFPIYVHTGVITNLSSTPNDWRYVKTTWGQPTNQPSITYQGNNIWRIVIPIKSYYGVPLSETILKLAFVFRNADGSKVGRDTDGSDMFIPIYQPGLNVGFVTPIKYHLASSLLDSVKITIASAQSNSLSLYVDNTLVGQTNSSQLTYYLKSTTYSKKRLRAVAIGNSQTVSDSVYVIFNPPVETQGRPVGMQDGINYTSSTSVLLSLYAPYKNFIYVIGDFSNWELDPNYYMKKTPDGQRWWIEITGLTPQKEYAFQYLVDGKLKIADPYTDKILDPWNDKYISSSTYPDLIPYPNGKTTDIVSIFQTNQTPYNWQTINYQRPNKTDLVIYELLIRDFVSKHDYKTLIDTLNYLKKLGVNAIELMPITEFEGNESWGYNVSFHFAPDKYYGPKNDLKKFIDVAHQQGFAVILDLVLNHAFGQSPLVKLYWDSANNQPAANSPWFNQVARHPYNVGYDFNHESQATKDYVDRVCKYWLTEYKFDGFRFDLSKGFTQTYSGSDVGLWSQYDASRIAILKRIADKIWQLDSTAYVILEHFADNREETELSNYGMLLWGNLNYNYNEATMGWHDGGKSDFSWGSYKSRGWSKPHLITYMESHDEERLMYKNLTYGNSSGNYNIKSLTTALERIKLATAFFFTIPGPKLIWQFGELGYDITINYNGRTGNKPIRWDYFDDGRRRSLYKTFSALINLRQNYEAFKSTNYLLDVASSIKKIYLNHPTMDVVVAGNFDVIQKDLSLNFQSTGYWYDYFSGDSTYVSQQTTSFNYQPGEFHLYTSVKLPKPDTSYITDVEYETYSPTEFLLYQNYPNPFNPITRIEFRTPNYAFITLKVYDILGREVATLVNEPLTAGQYSVEWNASNFSSGIYIYKLTSGSFTETKKMTVLK